MHEQQQQFAPWGTVTPTYWHVGQPEQPVQAAHVPQTREAPAPEPEPVHRPDADGQPEAQAQTSGAVNESQVSEAGSGGPPAEYQARISAIVAAFDAPDDAARLDGAAVDAEQLDQEFTAQYGQQHPHTINLRELRGWLAYLQGQMGTAARWYLHTTGLQAQVWGSRHQVTQGSVQRAVHIWLSIPDAGESFAVGQELLAMLAAVTGEGSGLSRKVRSRLESMGAQGGA
ncbi:hypothetical protein [Streptomyces sp. NPDC058247]|uniref:hypothetical protein n=1 Tax=Streptomyces sp. NPDC058247 TaxID=3346401 RepID=UPI0036E4E041